MAIYSINNDNDYREDLLEACREILSVDNDEDADMLAEAVDYVEGCINGDYEVDEELLEACAMHILETAAEDTTKKSYEAQNKIADALAKQVANIDKEIDVHKFNIKKFNKAKTLTSNPKILDDLDNKIKKEYTAIGVLHDKKKKLTAKAEGKSVKITMKAGDKAERQNINDIKKTKYDSGIDWD